ncbi:recombinase family protein [Streptomyces sp. NPDC088183]|uniref:recombinase family protein n=1 Tax=Streptomyces sp. NPDC088183 TaxID=3160992 RepID=UPI003443FA90
MSRCGSGACSSLTQELQSQLDALAGYGIPRDKIFSEKISTRVRVRPRFEAALAAAREIKPHAPHCRVIFTVNEMKRLGRDAAELTALADHLTAHGLVLEMLASPLQGMYDPSGPGRLLFGFFAAMAETERENIRESTLEGLDAAARKGNHGGRPPVITDDMLTPCYDAARTARPSSGFSPTCSSHRSPQGPQPQPLQYLSGTRPEHEETRAYPEVVEAAHADFAALHQRDHSPRRGSAFTPKIISWRLLGSPWLDPYQMR